jgi:hypothetical protein
MVESQTTRSRNDMTIRDVAIFEEVNTGVNIVVVVRLEDDSMHQIVNHPIGRGIHLDEADFIGHTLDKARRAATCWIQAAERGVHRIARAELVRVDPLELAPGEAGTTEVRATLSDGSVERVILVDAGTPFGEPSSLVGLTLEQARNACSALDQVRELTCPVCGNATH